MYVVIISPKNRLDKSRILCKIKKMYVCFYNAFSYIGVLVILVGLNTEWSLLSNIGQTR